MTKPDRDHGSIKAGEMEISIDPGVATGVYANLAMINHSPDDFMLDFIFVQPGGKVGSVQSRVILSPGHLKRLLQAMQTNLQRYEQTFGPIPEHQPQIQTPTGPVN